MAGNRTTVISVAGGGGPGSTNVEYYVYDGQQVAADLDENGNIIRSYTWGPGIDNLLSMTVYTTGETNTYFAIKDVQNSIYALVDESGSVVESYQYDAWGRTTVFDATGNQLTESSIGNRYCFQGREIDWTTGLIYFRARWYNPKTGRWLSKDPIGISGGLNMYVFCGNNPVNFVDPMGQEAITAVIGAIAGAVSGAISGYASGGVAGAIVGGAVGGIVGGVVGAVMPMASSSVGAMVGGFVGGAIGSATAQGVTTGSVNVGGALGAGVAGAAGAGMGILAAAGLPAAAASGPFILGGTVGEIATGAGTVVGTGAASLLENAGANIFNGLGGGSSCGGK